VKRRSFPDPDSSSFTLHKQRVTVRGMHIIEVG